MEILADRGLIYSSFNEGSAGELSASAARAKAIMPGIHITAFAQYDVSNVDNFIRIGRMTVPDKALSDYPDQGFYWKVKNAGRGPYKTSIFLDTDTYIVEPIWSIFELIESGKYHLAVVHDAGRFAHDVPDCFGSFNTGVIAYDNSQETQGFFTLWWDYFVERGSAFADQPTFQKALYDSGLQFTTLPVEYNLRYIFPVWLWSKVSILHGRAGGEPEDVAKKMNAHYNDPRLWVPRYANKDGKIICRFNKGDMWVA